MTLSEALSSYLSAQRGTISQDAQVELNRFVRWCGASRPVQEVTPRDVAEYTGSLVASGGDVRERLAGLRAFLSYLKQQRLAPVSLASYVKVPRAKALSAKKEGSGHEPVYLTQGGYEALAQEVRDLKAHRAALSEDIRRAAADKDVRENAPLEAARERQGHAESRIRALEQRLHRAALMGEDGVAAQQVQLGHQVVLREARTSREVVYRLVHPTEADPLQGRLSVVSPVGKALLGRMAGDQVRVAVPGGALLYHIVEIRQ